MLNKFFFPWFAFVSANFPFFLFLFFSPMGFTFIALHINDGLKCTVLLEPLLSVATLQTHRSSSMCVHAGDNLQDAVFQCLCTQILLGLFGRRAE